MGVETWVRVLISAAAGVLAILDALWWRKGILRRLLHATSRESGWRAFGVALLYHLFLILAAVFASIVVGVLYDVFESGVPAAVMAAIAMAVLAPFTLIFFPDPPTPSAPSGGSLLPAVEVLSSLGSSQVVARVLAVTGVVLLFPLLFVFGSAAVGGILSF